MIRSPIPLALARTCGSSAPIPLALARTCGSSAPIPLALARAPIASFARLASLVGVAALMFGCASQAATDINNNRDASEVASETKPLKGKWDFDTEAMVAARVNEARTGAKLSSLDRVACLNTAARAWSAHLAIIHVPASDPNLGKDTVSPCLRSGYLFERVSESVAITTTPTGALKAVANEKAKAGDFDSIGVGAFRQADGSIVVTALYGKMM